ncbi:MAG: acyl carrier protein [Deltaproteobacteria bacterium]
MTTDEIIRSAIADASKRPLASITTASRLAEDLGLRSLGRIELAVMLERRLGKAVRDDQVMTAVTVADLERMLGA